MSKDKKILVGEDSSIIINLTKSVLAFENYSMKAARNGEQVLELLEKENFDLILMDLNMPVLDGVECTKMIRAMADPVKSKLPIIAILETSIIIQWMNSGKLVLMNSSKNPLILISCLPLSRNTSANPWL